MSVKDYIDSLDGRLPIYCIGLKDMLNRLTTGGFGIDKVELEANLKLIAAFLPNFYQKDLEIKLVEIATRSFNDVSERLIKIKSLDEKAYETMFTSFEKIKAETLEQIKNYASLVCRPLKIGVSFGNQGMTRTCGLGAGSGRNSSGCGLAGSSGF
jgi:hypothetical protein